MADVTLDLTIYGGINDDMDFEILIFQGDKDESVYSGTCTIDQVVEEYIAVRQNFRTGVLEDSFIGDADVLAQKLRNAAEALERAVLRAEEEKDAS